MHSILSFASFCAVTWLRVVHHTSASVSSLLPETISTFDGNDDDRSSLSPFLFPSRALNLKGGLLVPTPAPSPVSTAPDTRFFSYTTDDTLILNPERGFYTSVSLTESTNLDWVRDEDLTLVHSYVRLDDYKWVATLPTSLLNNIAAGLGLLRQAGIKVVLRFSYNFAMGPDVDTTLDQMLRHIDQLSPILNDNKDVLAVVQAGFIGAWGEWHNSSYGVDTTANKQIVLDRLLDTLDESIFVQARYPEDIRDFFPTPLTAHTAYVSSRQARTGHHNDCFLSNQWDTGTWNWGNDRLRVELRDYTQAVAPYIPIGGETCQVTPELHISDCPTTLSELTSFRWDYLNSEFFSGDINRWKEEGCYDEIARRLGYQIKILSLSVAQLASSTLELKFSLRNDGFSTIYKQRDVVIVIRDASGEETSVTVNGDARLWLPPAGSTVSRTVSLAASFGPGVYEILLHLPDAAPGLRTNAFYSIRLSNTGTWEGSTGYNVLGSITI